MDWLLEIGKVILGFVLGVGVTFARARNDQLHKYIDDLERTVRDFADSAARYWSFAASHPENLALEVKLRQLSQRIATELRFITKTFPKTNFSSWGLVVSLRKTATGADFGRRTRGPDQYRAKDTEDAATALIHAIRRMRPRRFF